MKKIVALMFAVLVMTATLQVFADEKSDAEAAINEAQKWMDKLNDKNMHWMAWPLFFKLKAEKAFEEAKEAFAAGDYVLAKEKALKARRFAIMAMRVRIWRQWTRPD